MARPTGPAPTRIFKAELDDRGFSGQSLAAGRPDIPLHGHKDIDDNHPD